MKTKTKIYLNGGQILHGNYFEFEEVNLKIGDRLRCNHFPSLVITVGTLTHDNFFYDNRGFLCNASNFELAN